MKTVLAAVNSQYVHTNLALRGIGAYAQKNGVNTELAEFSVNDTLNSVVERLYAYHADIYAFSCYIWNIEYILKLASSLAKLLEEAVIILGGPEVSFDQEALLRTNPAVDYIISLEGEIAFCALVKALEKGTGTDIPGVTYRKKGQIITAANADPGAMEALPFAYATLPENYKSRIIYYETSRGCPFNCAYCLSSIDKRVRALPLARVFGELKFFMDRDVPLVKFVDRTFNWDAERAQKIWRFLIENKSKTKFHFEIGAQLINDKDIALLSEAPAGLFQFEIGIQSSDDKILAHIGRSARFERVSRAVEAIIALGSIPVHLDLIAGLPGDDLSCFAESINQAYALRAERLQLGFLKLLKGTSLRETYTDCVYTDYPPYEVLSTATLSAGDILLLKDIERALDLVVNSKRFDAALALMEACFDAPFDMLKALALYLKAHELLYAPLSMERVYRLVYCFLKDHSGSGFIEDALKYDFFRSGTKKGFSDWLGISDEKTLSKALSVKHGFKVFVQKYGFDTALFRSKRVIVPGESLEVYDASTNSYQYLYNML